MNRAQLVEAMSEISKQSKNEGDKWLNAFIEVVKSNIHNDVKLVGFGTFKVAERQARVARNPQTGESIQIPARKVPVFKPGVELKEFVK